MMHESVMFCWTRLTFMPSVISQPRPGFKFLSFSVFIAFIITVSTCALATSVVNVKGRQEGDEAGGEERDASILDWKNNKTT